MSKKILKIRRGHFDGWATSYYLDDEEAKETLYVHACSDDCFATSDLILDRPDRIEELDKKYGKGNWEVDKNIEQV